MALLARAAVFAALAVAVGCQRLPREDDDDFSTSAPPPTSDGGDEFGTFLPEESGGQDDGGPAFECDPVAQSGCAGSEKCTATKTGGSVNYVCVSDPANLEPFSPCSASLDDGADNCPVGFVCLEDATNAGVCVPLCVGNPDCETGLCVEDPIEMIPHCGGDCSPFDSLCPAPMQCRRASDRFVCRFPSEIDVGAGGEPCDQLDDLGCGPGLVCVAGALIPGCETSNCCTTVCDTMGAAICVAPSTCAVLFDAPAPGFETIGACFVPA